MAQRALREMVGHLIIDASDEKLGHAIARLRRDDVRLNVNLLGEAILGETEEVCLAASGLSYAIAQQVQCAWIMQPRSLDDRFVRDRLSLETCERCIERCAGCSREEKMLTQG